jgi:GNAT superfamily N-acetyltransferase
MEHSGTYAVFDGVQSPATQTFGLGIFEPASPAAMDVLEAFFLGRGAPVFHEVSPFAGVATLELLCSRNYRPLELSNVLYRPLDSALPQPDNRIQVRLIAPDEAPLWADTSARGWAHEYPELRDFLLQFAVISSARDQTRCFLAELNGRPGATAALCFDRGVALFAGGATVPEARGRGLQTALLYERMRFAFEQRCDVAMMAAEPGSASQRNAERRGFRIAYTRTKWQLRR